MDIIKLSQGRFMKNKIIHIMPYLFMPMLLCLLCYCLFSLVLTPVQRLIDTTLVISLSDETPIPFYELKTIYKADTIQETRVYEAELYQPTPDITDINEDNSTNIEEVVRINEIQFPKLGEHYGMISCERINLEVPVYWGDTKKILSTGVGQFMGSFLPGFNRCILLSAHNNTFFKPLEIIQEGDIINYSTNYGEYQYLIDEVSILNTGDAEEMLEHVLGRNGEKLIMYTCYPFRSNVSNKEKRLFVYGNKVSGPEVEMAYGQN